MCAIHSVAGAGLTGYLTSKYGFGATIPMGLSTLLCVGGTLYFWRDYTKKVKKSAHLEAEIEQLNSLP